MKAALSPGSRVRRKIACFLGFHKTIQATFSPMAKWGPTWIEKCSCGRRRIRNLHTDWTRWGKSDEFIASFF